MTERKKPNMAVIKELAQKMTELCEREIERIETGQGDSVKRDIRSLFSDEKHVSRETYVTPLSDNDDQPKTKGEKLTVFNSLIN